MTNQIFAYSSDLTSGSSSWGALENAWASSWANSGGFDAHIAYESDLTPDDVVLHETTTRQTPTVNPRQYEDACWERWSAWLNVCPPEGALFADLDMLNTGGFTPADLPATIPDSGFVVLHEGVMPTLVAATPAGLAAFRDVCTDPAHSAFQTPCTVRGRPHFSDMEIFARWAPGVVDLTTPRKCFFFTGVAAAKPPVVHFANDSVARAGYPSRGAAIRAFARGHGLTQLWGGPGTLDYV